MAEEFKFANGDVVEVKRFQYDRYQYLYCGQPAKNVGDYTGTIQVYFDPEFHKWYKTLGDGVIPADSPEAKKIYTGALGERSAIGLPRGSLVPVRWNGPMRRFDIVTSTLINTELYVNRELANQDVLNILDKLKD